MAARCRGCRTPAGRARGFRQPGQHRPRAGQLGVEHHAGDRGAAIGPAAAALALKTTKQGGELLATINIYRTPGLAARPWSWRTIVGRAQKIGTPRGECMFDVIIV